MWGRETVDDPMCGRRNGGVLRRDRAVLIAIACNRRFPDFPVGTLIINVSGSFMLGWLAAYAATHAGFSQTMRIAIGVGFVGAYTTFSTFMVESDNLLRRGAMVGASMNLIGSVVLGLIAVRLGVLCASK
jgi:CrcB protein